MYLDIYQKMGEYLLSHNWYESDFSTQKTLLDMAYKNYTLNKIYEINPNFPNLNSNLSFPTLFKILSSLIPESKHCDTLRFYTHYLISIISSFQSYEMLWTNGNDNPKTISIDIKDDKWNCLITSDFDNLETVFLSLYYCFQEYFKKDILLRKLEFTSN